MPRRRVSFPLAAGLAIVLLCSFVGFVLLSLKEPHGAWDGWSIWNLHARFLFRGGQYWRDICSPLLWAYKPDYPLLVPASIARLWNYEQHETLFAPSLLAGVFTFGVAGVTASAVARLRGANQGLLAGLILLGTPGLVLQGAGENGDVPIAFFFVATLVLLCFNDYLNQHNGYLALAGIAAGLAAWTKNEGLMLLLAVVAVRFLLQARKLGLRGLLLQNAAFFAGLMPVLVPIVFFKERFAPTNDMMNGQGPHAIAVRFMTVSRYVITGKALAHEALSFGDWFVPVLLVLALYALLVGFDYDRERRTAVLAPLLTVMLAAAGYFFVYIATPHELAWQLRNSLSRVLMQLWPAFVFSTFLVLRTPEEAAKSCEFQTTSAARPILVEAQLPLQHTSTSDARS